QSEYFGDSFAEERPVVRPRSKASDINRPQIHGLLAVQHPFRQIFAGTARRSDANRIEASENKEISQFRSLAHEKAIVRSKALGPIHKLGELRLLQCRDAMFAVGQRFGEFLPIRFERSE